MNSWKTVFILLVGLFICPAMQKLSLAGDRFLSPKSHLLQDSELIKFHKLKQKYFDFYKKISSKKSIFTETDRLIILEAHAFFKGISSGNIIKWDLTRNESKVSSFTYLKYAILDPLFFLFQNLNINLVNSDNQADYRKIVRQLSTKAGLHDLSHLIRFVSFFDLMENKAIASLINSIFPDLSVKESAIRNSLGSFNISSSKFLSSFILFYFEQLVQDELSAMEYFERLLSESQNDADTWMVGALQEYQNEGKILLRKVALWKENPSWIDAESIRIVGELNHLLYIYKNSFHNKLSSIQIQEGIGSDPYQTNSIEVKMSLIALQDILYNLLNNAVDALQGINKAEIRVSAAREVRDKVPFLRITCKDNGKGMEPAVLEKLRNNEKITTKGILGSGEGLQGVYEALDNCNGFIEIVSEKGKGSEFSVFLPVFKENGIIVHEHKLSASA